MTVVYVLIYPIYMKKIDFMFVCQPGFIEFQALMFVCSFRKNVKTPYKLIAAVPGPVDFFGTLHPETVDMFKRLNVEIQYVTNQEVVNTPRKNLLKCQLIANKIFALEQVTSTADMLVFLDSDQLCTDDLADLTWSEVPIAVRHEGWYGMNDYGADLNKIFSLAGAAMPLRKYVYTPDSIEQKCIVLHSEVNASFIGLSKEVRTEVVKKWLHVYRSAMQNNVPSYNYYTEQACFLASVLALLVPYTFIHDPLVPISHYHRAESLIQDTDLMMLVAEIFKQEPHIMNAGKPFADWNLVVETAKNLDTSL